MSKVKKWTLDTVPVGACVRLQASQIHPAESRRYWIIEGAEVEDEGTTLFVRMPHEMRTAKEMLAMYEMRSSDGSWGPCGV